MQMVKTVDVSARAKVVFNAALDYGLLKQSINKAELLLSLD